MPSVAIAIDLIRSVYSPQFQLQLGLDREKTSLYYNKKKNLKKKLSIIRCRQIPSCTKRRGNIYLSTLPYNRPKKERKKERKNERKKERKNERKEGRKEEKERRKKEMRNQIKVDSTCVIPYNNYERGHAIKFIPAGIHVNVTCMWRRRGMNRKSLVYPRYS